MHPLYNRQTIHRFLKRLGSPIQMLINLFLIKLFFSIHVLDQTCDTKILGNTIHSIRTSNTHRNQAHHFPFPISGADAPRIEWVIQRRRADGVPVAPGAAGLEHQAVAGRVPNVSSRLAFPSDRRTWRSTGGQQGAHMNCPPALLLRCWPPQC